MPTRASCRRDGRAAGLREGRALGVQKGSEIAREVGFYAGAGGSRRKPGLRQSAYEALACE